MWGRISTTNSSPSWRYSLGFLMAPMPDGVPVMINVPGSRVVPWERKLTSLGTLKIMSLFSRTSCSLVSLLFLILLSLLLSYTHTHTLPARNRGLYELKGRREKNTHSSLLCCMTLPFLRPRIVNDAGSLMTELDTSTGPMGQAPSKPLE